MIELFFFPEEDGNLTRWNLIKISIFYSIFIFSENLYNWIMMYIFNDKIGKHVYRFKGIDYFLGTSRIAYISF